MSYNAANILLAFNLKSVSVSQTFNPTKCFINDYPT